jgi:hypothetical protein
MVRQLFFLCVFIYSINAVSQVYEVPELFSPAGGALLPDSSIIIVKNREKGRSLAGRYVFRNGSWTEQNNQLIELMNASLTDGHFHFRFSQDYSKLILLVHEYSGQRFYVLNKLENGQWSFPVEILQSENYDYNNSIPSFSYDNKLLYVSGGQRGNKTWDSFDIIDVENNYTKKAEIRIPALESIDRVLSIGEKSLLILGAKKKQKEMTYYLVKRIGEDEWTAPILVQDLKNNYFGLATTAFSSKMIFSDFGTSKVYMVETPSIVQYELGWRSVRDQPIQPTLTQNIPEDQSGRYITPTGNYHALLIGNADYQNDDLDLTKPVDDADVLKETLINYYSFEPDHVQVLKNANRDKIFEVFYELRNKLSDDDNLLIFYAGHGHWDNEVEQGYWWPVDAEPNNPSNWLSNSDLREQIRGLHTAHTLLISDACFSGGIFKTRGSEEIRNAPQDIKLLYRLPSRRAMSSGNLSSVPDNSVFFKYLIKKLVENEEKFLSSADLFTQIRRGVLNNSLTVPQDGVIIDTGDEGGDFIFIKRD